MIRFKIDVVAKLKESGYSTYRIRKEKIFGESILTRMRRREIVSFEVLDKLCVLLNLQPADLIEHIDD